jgi:hypothetical protein
VTAVNAENQITANRINEIRGRALRISVSYVANYNLLDTVACSEVPSET